MASLLYSCSFLLVHKDVKYISFRFPTFLIHLPCAPWGGPSVRPNRPTLGPVGEHKKMLQFICANIFSWKKIQASSNNVQSMMKQNNLCCTIRWWISPWFQKQATHRIVAMSLSHLSDDNAYRASKKRPEKDVQNIIIQAVDCNQLLVLPSISSVGNLANDPLGERETDRKKIQTTLQVICSIWVSNPQWWRLCPRLGSNRGVSFWESILRIWWQWTTNPQLGGLSNDDKKGH